MLLFGSLQRFRSVLPTVRKLVIKALKVIKRETLSFHNVMNLTHRHVENMEIAR